MRKHIRGIVLVLLILLLPCLVWAEDEPENDIEITLNWGFNGKAGNSDACLPVTATLTNHGEAFEGQLEMEVPVAGNQESDLGESLTMIGNDMDYTRSKVCVWKKNIALAAGETRQETFYLTFPWANGTVQAYLKDGSRTVQTASLSKNFSANQDIALIGVIGAQPEDVQQLDGIQISEETTEGMGDIFVSVYQMDASEIPDSWKDLGQLDALLIGPEAAISGEQWVTLHRWQQEGGILLTVEDGQDQIFYTDSFLCLSGRTGTVPDPEKTGKKKIFLVRSYTAFCSFPWYCSFAGNRHQTDCPDSYHETDVYPAGSYLGRNAAAGCAGAI